MITAEMDVVSVAFPVGRDRGDFTSTDKSMTQQSLSADSDINNIIRKFEKTGLVTHVTDKVAQYGDFTQIPDFQTMLNTVRHAESQFMMLPAELRERFDNDPAKMVAFLSDSRNFKEGVSLGLLEAKSLEKASDAVSRSEALKSEAKAVGVQAVGAKPDGSAA